MCAKGTAPRRGMGGYSHVAEPGTNGTAAWLTPRAAFLAQTIMSLNLRLNV